MADVDRLFDEFAASYARGDRPDLAGYLTRAGDRAGELARLVEVFLRVAPAPEPGDEDVAVMRARLEGEPGLLALRRTRARKVDEVVAELASRLGVRDVTRLRRYYQRLEGGTLDPRPVDERVWDALRAVFAVNVRSIVRPVTTHAGESAMAYYRSSAEPPDAFAVLGDPPPGERDDLDRLFLGTG